MTETNAKPIEPTCSMCPSYPRIQAELDRLTAECQKWQEYHDAEYRERKKYRQDANYFAGEVDRLTSELKRMESECERRGKELLAIHKVLKDNVNDPDPLPASSPYCVSAPTTYGLVAGIVRERDELKKQAAAAESLAAEKEAECERLRDVIADSHDELLQKFDSNAVGHTDLYTWIKCQVAKIKRLESLAASRLADQEYKKVIDDALVVANIGAATGDAKADVHKLICWEIDVALDPRVSKRAADLIRLADHGAVERHVTRRVAGEIREIAINATGSRCSDDWDDAMAAIVEEIDQKYGVE